MKILDGKMVSEKILGEIKLELQGELGKPSMCIVMVGNNPASETYVKFKLRACEKAGLDAKLIRFDEDISMYNLYNEVSKLNKSHFDGFIIQLPLPKHINDQDIINAIDPLKDIDGFTPTNFGMMSLGLDKEKDFYLRPATPYGILKLIEHYEIETNGKHVVVLGRSNIVGKPMSILLGNDFDIGRSTVTTCDINTPRKLLVEQTRKADIIIVAVGKPGLLTEDMVSDGVVVIDVGINRVDGKLVGDVDFDNVSKKSSYITPVPGGVGPMTIAGLVLNTVECWKRNNFIRP